MLTERMLERTKIEIMLSASPSSVFSHNVHNITFEKQIHSILTNGTNRTWTTISIEVLNKDLKIL